jgi:hypothetical protein
MVGGDNAETTASNGAPHKRRLVFFPRRWSVNPLGTFEAGSIQVSFIEVQVMRARLANSVYASSACALDLLDGFRAAHMDEIDGRTDDFGQRSGAGGSLGSARGMPTSSAICARSTDRCTEANDCQSGGCAHVSRGDGADRASRGTGCHDAKWRIFR